MYRIFLLFFLALAFIGNQHTFAQSGQKIDKTKRLLIRALMATSLSSGTPIAVKITRDMHIKMKLGIHSKLSVNEKL